MENRNKLFSREICISLFTKGLMIILLLGHMTFIIFNKKLFSEYNIFAFTLDIIGLISPIIYFITLKMENKIQRRTFENLITISLIIPIINLIVWKIFFRL